MDTVEPPSNKAFALITPFRISYSLAVLLVLYIRYYRSSRITSDYIHSIDRHSHNLALPYTTIHNSVTIKQEELTLDSDTNDLTSLLNNIIEQNDVKVEESSDEEPLVKFVKKRKRKKKHDVKVTPPLPNLTQDIKPSIKAELEDLPLDFDDCFDNNDDQYDDVNDSKPAACDYDVEVVVLSKEEQILELQARKNTLNYKNSFYKCEMCFKGFMVESTYRNHMERHHPSFGRFSCDVCQLRFPNNRTQQQHKLATHSRNYICRICGHISKAKSRAKEHYKWHQGVLYVCDICGASFDKPTSHLTHVRTNHPSRHICSLCGASFVSAHGLLTHGRRAHRQLNEGQEPNPAYKCVLCGVQFSNEDAVAKHVSLTENEICDPTLRPCVFCGESFINEELLKKHVAQHQGEDKTYECIECNKTFSSARYQAAHYRRVHARIPNKPQPNKIHSNAVCEICGKKCTHPVVPKITYLPYVQVCNKTFSSARYQAAHYRRVHARIPNKPQPNKIHSNAVCEICGKKCTHPTKRVAYPFPFSVVTQPTGPIITPPKDVSRRGIIINSE
ncbi:hypothetical protein NE865_11361 [Phthorimaea operculella]|nr:hypothetical protein NE865_11361 [Phthorimaea operculella]